MHRKSTRHQPPNPSPVAVSVQQQNCNPASSWKLPPSYVHITSSIEVAMNPRNEQLICAGGKASILYRMCNPLESSGRVKNLRDAMTIIIRSYLTPNSSSHYLHFHHKRARLALKYTTLPRYHHIGGVNQEITNEGTKTRWDELTLFQDSWQTPILVISIFIFPICYWRSFHWSELILNHFGVTRKFIHLLLIYWNT